MKLERVEEVWIMGGGLRMGVALETGRKAEIEGREGEEGEGKLPRRVRYIGSG